MDYSTAKKLQSQHERLCDQQLWHDKVSRLVDILLQLQDQMIDGEMDYDVLKTPRQDGCKNFARLSKGALLQVRFSKELLDLSTKADKEVQQILADLDIEAQDCLRLSHTLDRNQDGTLDVMEFISGLQLLRGPARRGDVIAVDLAVQSMQAKIDEIWLHFKNAARGHGQNHGQNHVHGHVARSNVHQL